MDTQSYCRRNRRAAGIGLWAWMSLFPMPVLAEGGDDPVLINPSPGRMPSAAEIRNAKPFQNPLPPPDTSAVQPAAGVTVKVAGAIPGHMGEKGPVDNSYITRAFGSFGVPYTEARVKHKPTGAVGARSGGYLSATYPYRAIGRLTFDVGYCSASLIRRSVLVTAAHCIQNFGSGGNTFSGWTFSPAYYDGNNPYGTWGYLVVVWPGSWANGTDIGTGSARDNDLAVIIVAKSGGDQFIGDIVGYFSYGWNNYSFVNSANTGYLWTAAVSTLGYPGLLDSGRIQQRTDGPSYLTEIEGAGQIYQGSNFTGGSSGGPWLVNFKYQDPAFSGGTNAGLRAARNVIIGVTSWGTADPNVPKDNYSSQFRQNARYPLGNYGGFGAGNIASLLNTACNVVASGGLTYQQLGYCN